MKLSLLLAVVILLSATIAAKYYDRRITEHEIATRHSPFVRPAYPESSGQIPNRSTADQEASHFAASLVDDLKILSSATSDPSLEKSVQERLVTFTPRQARAVVHLLIESSDLDPKIREMVVALSLTKLAADFPMEAIQWLPQFTPSIENERHRRMLGEQITTTALISWAQNDPFTAVAWIKAGGPLVDTFVSEKNRLHLLTPVASKDLNLAFQLLETLDPANPEGALATIARSAANPGQRSQILDLSRAYLTRITDKTLRQNLVNSTITSLASEAFEDGFATTSQWAVDNFQDDELIHFSSAIQRLIPSSGEAPEWIVWQHENLPSETATSNIRKIITEWTLADHQTAARWLLDSPPGEVRDIATEAYLKTASPYLSSHPTLAPILSQLQNH